MLDRFEEIIICFSLLLISVYLEYDSKIFKTFLSDFNNPKFVTSLVMVTIFIIYLLKKKNEGDKRTKILDSLKKSLIALIIAYLSHLDLIFMPFWLIFSMAFFFHDWV